MRELLKPTAFGGVDARRDEPDDRNWCAPACAHAIEVSGVPSFRACFVSASLSNRNRAKAWPFWHAINIDVAAVCRLRDGATP